MLTRRGLTIIGVASACATAGVLAAVASAAITVRFSQTWARPGTAITVYQPGGLRWVRRDRGPLRVYLLDAAVAGSATHTTSGALRHAPPSKGFYVGNLALPRGRLKFRVPWLPPRRYAAVVWCAPCGNTLISSVPTDVPADVAMRPDGSLLRIVH